MFVEDGMFNFWILLETIYSNEYVWAFQMCEMRSYLAFEALNKW